VIVERDPQSADRAEWAMRRPSLVEWMAWRRYLIATRARGSAEYAVIEEAAWTRLLDDLTRLELPPSRDRSVPAGQSARTTRGGFGTLLRVKRRERNSKDVRS
jgi:hypothetical protein